MNTVITRLQELWTYPGHTSVESLYRCVDEMIAVEKTCLYLFGVVCVHECSSWLLISHTARIVGFWSNAVGRFNFIPHTSAQSTLAEVTRRILSATKSRFQRTLIANTCIEYDSLSSWRVMRRRGFGKLFNCAWTLEDEVPYHRHYEWRRGIFEMVLKCVAWSD